MRLILFVLLTISQTLTFAQKVDVFFVSDQLINKGKDTVELNRKKFSDVELISCICACHEGLFSEEGKSIAIKVSANNLYTLWGKSLSKINSFKDLTGINAKERIIVSNNFGKKKNATGTISFNYDSPIRKYYVVLEIEFPKIFRSNIFKEESIEISKVDNFEFKIVELKIEDYSHLENIDNMFLEMPESENVRLGYINGGITAEKSEETERLFKENKFDEVIANLEGYKLIDFQKKMLVDSYIKLKELNKAIKVLEGSFEQEFKVKLQELYILNGDPKLALSSNIKLEEFYTNNFRIVSAFLDKIAMSEVNPLFELNESEIIELVPFFDLVHDFGAIRNHVENSKLISKINKKKIKTIIGYFEK
ncbi:hypothetical protein [Lacihabitans soyangensis]|uniref:Uncharacterized protein n=1 Tax=Lacihabitans soyangensis TaxID=869394 RepID=A0AAE3H6Z7_9BACT|nr:hypothetical protein [Lacihabitans soyangensis]MCP9766093.1 hypothetical protein [Lacihabitans soyangensis]